MIAASTTFVVGAGASVPWGLPTAAELTSRARDPRTPSRLMDSLQEALGVTHVEFAPFLGALRADPTSSIDVFLETHTDEVTRRIGRGMIAALMGRDIKKHQQRRPKRQENWLLDIVDAMRAGARDLDSFVKGNRVRFVTFNFDSVIEHELEGALRAIYPADAAAITAAVGQIPVVHVHGRLPPPDPSGRPPQAGVNPPVHVSPAWIASAMEHVKVVHDQVPDGVLNRARQFIKGADVVCFLGFSYHPENLSKLAIREFVQDRLSPPSARATAYGTTCKMPQSEQLRVAEAFSDRIRLQPSGLDCAGALQNDYIVRY